MQIHELQRTIKKRNIKRIGRGGKRGTYSGKGQKGQRARAGHKIRPAERDVISKIPKLRGVKNKSLKNKSFIINVGDLGKIGSEKIDKKIFLNKSLIKKLSEEVKILSEGEVKTPFFIQGVKTSKAAKEKIEKAGGSVK